MAPREVSRKIFFLNNCWPQNKIMDSREETNKNFFGPKGRKIKKYFWPQGKKKIKIFLAPRETLVPREVK